MNRIILTFLTLITINSNAQQAPSLLWKISGNGLSQPSYLFGTIHMIPKDDYFFTDTMQWAFKASKTFVLEANMFGLSLGEQVKMAQQVILDEGKTLANYMDSTEYKAFRQMVIDSIGIKENTFDNKYCRIKPFFLSALLLQEYVGKTKTYEEEFYNMAQKEKMQTIGLETVQYQLDLANQLSIQDQLEGITNYSEFKKYYQLVEVYKQQNLDSLYAMAIAEYNHDSEKTFLNAFLYQRNQNWIPILEGLITVNSCFIAVGAMHLPNQGGVIDLLRKKGYTVEAMR